MSYSIPDINSKYSYSKDPGSSPENYEHHHKRKREAEHDPQDIDSGGAKYGKDNGPVSKKQKGDDEYSYDIDGGDIDAGDKTNPNAPVAGKDDVNGPVSKKTSDPVAASGNVTTGQTSSDGTSDAGKTLSTGTGTGQTFNVTNDTGRDQYYAFSSNSSKESGPSNQINAVMKLGPGETASFEAGSDVPGIRINSSGPNGEAKEGQNLFEDTIESNNPYAPGQTVHNADVSRVSGAKSYDGNPESITFKAAGKTVGDDPNADIPSYLLWNDDTLAGAANPMQLGLTPAPVIDIRFS